MIVRSSPLIGAAFGVAGAGDGRRRRRVVVLFRARFRAGFRVAFRFRRGAVFLRFRRAPLVFFRFRFLLAMLVSSQLGSRPWKSMNVPVKS